jgi:hypothetical protein
LHRFSAKKSCNKSLDSIRQNRDPLLWNDADFALRVLSMDR